MPEQHADAEDPDPAAAADAQTDRTEQIEQIEHDPSGLNLARTVAGAISRQRGRPRRRPGPDQRGRRARVIDPRSAGAHPDDRDPQLLTTALDRLVDSQGWSREVSVRTLLGTWPRLVGPDNAAHSMPVGYQDTVVTVRAESTAWATQLRLMAPMIVAKLNEALGDGTVTRVTILGPDVPSWKRGRRSVRDGRGPRDTYG